MIADPSSWCRLHIRWLATLTSSGVTIGEQLIWPIQPVQVIQKPADGENILPIPAGKT